MHTNDAISSVTRPFDMGVEPFLLSSSLLGVLAQRVVGKLCPLCKTQDASGPKPGRWPAVGCPHCTGTPGCKGRTGVHELMVAVDKVLSLIQNRAAESEFFVAAEQAGLKSMREDGERLMRTGRQRPARSRQRADRTRPGESACNGAVGGDDGDEGHHRRHRKLSTHLKGEVNAGSSFARALATSPREFDDIYRAVVAAGEQSGAPGIVLDKLADDLEPQQALRSNALNALAQVREGVPLASALMRKKRVPEFLSTFAYLSE